MTTDGTQGATTPPPAGRSWRRILVRVVLAAVALFAVIQLVPYGRSHSNPPVTAEPAWNAPATRVLFSRACGDCHSNATTWPWYSNVAPVSWLVQNDVDGGRAALNVSEWDRPQEEAGDVAEKIREGEMPPSYYTWMHSSAKLSTAEQAALIAGWEATMRTSPPVTAGR
jgi:mono/diheme cytochrome c family protein